MKKKEDYDKGKGTGISNELNQKEIQLIQHMGVFIKKRKKNKDQEEYMKGKIIIWTYYEAMKKH